MMLHQTPTINEIEEVTLVIRARLGEDRARFDLHRLIAKICRPTAYQSQMCDQESEDFYSMVMDRVLSKYIYRRKPKAKTESKTTSTGLGGFISKAAMNIAVDLARKNKSRKQSIPLSTIQNKVAGEQWQPVGRLEIDEAIQAIMRMEKSGQLSRSQKHQLRKYRQEVCS
jgi:hypothetical protein